MAILVTGGAGYIGSVTVERLREANEAVVVLDDLARGHRVALDAGVPFYQGRVGDHVLVDRISREHKVDSCIHFAALAYVGESVEKPAIYFENNVEQGIILVRALMGAGVRHFVFSSTCATYGEPEELPIRENATQRPTNPYGWSKLIIERLLDSCSRAYALQFVALRYFNAAGATKRNGDHHEPESHLIPNILGACAAENGEISVFGKDYPTRDGTTIRDYIHVSDLADAHIRALNHLRKGGNSGFLNLGTGVGYSILEVIDAARRVTERDIKIRFMPRRPGDPAHLVADPTEAAKVLDWQPVRSDLVAILRSQWEWNRRHPKGYNS